MGNLQFVLAAIAASIGAFFLVSGLSAESHFSVFGATIKSKFGILLGGVGICAGLAIAVEALSKRRPKQPAKTG